jgi:hypothetical protein
VLVGGGCVAICRQLCGVRKAVEVNKEVKNVKKEVACAGKR